MPLWAAFVGPAYRARSSNMAAETLKNAYLETIASTGNAKQANFYGTPGSKTLLTVGTAVGRGNYDQDGWTLITVGGTLYRLDLVLTTATALGPIFDDGKPVSYASNGRGGEQILIVGGGFAYILDLLTGALSAPVTLPLTFAPVMCAFIDGYFLILEANTIRVWFSALEDGTSWSGLDFFARSQTSDNLVGIKVLRDKVWLFGSLTTEIFYDSGDTNNPFVPYPGSIMQEGLVSPWAVGNQGESLVWMSQDNEGRGRVVSATDYTPVRISTPALDFALASYPVDNISKAELLVYEAEGHPFACWTIPGITTWCFDARESALRQEPIWHERTTYDPVTATTTAWRARGVCSTSVGILVGDTTTGAIYTLDLDTFCDACGPLRRERTSAYLSAENQWMFIQQIELGIQAGVGAVLGDAANPVIMGEISRDGGHTWDPPVEASLGPLGDYNATAIWYLCGRVRSDRFVFRVTQTDEVRTVWGPGLWIRATAGTGNL